LNKPYYTEIIPLPIKTATNGLFPVGALGRLHKITAISNKPISGYKNTDARARSGPRVARLRDTSSATARAIGSRPGVRSAGQAVDALSRRLAEVVEMGAKREGFFTSVLRVRP
jgi:hypothetical protein